MGDMEVYRALFGLTEVWTVAGVDVDMAGQWVSTNSAGSNSRCVVPSRHAFRNSTSSSRAI